MQLVPGLVSIYIPTRDRFDLLQRAVQSCLQQDYPNFELIISDDGSSPQVQQQIQQLAKADSRISILLSAEAKGACAARNRAIETARGEFITGLDDDDEFTPNRLRLFVEQWQKMPDVAYLCANADIIVAQGKFLHMKKRPQAITLQQLLHTNLVGNQLFTKTAYLRAIGGFDEQLQARQDYETWLRLSAQYGSGYRIKDVTYLVHQDHNLERISNSSRRVQGYDYVYKKHEDKMNSAQKASHKFYRCLYTENPTLFALLAKTPLRLWPVAIKVISLRMLGYKV
ncbi:glycosyltransferase [Rheinheimera sp.]|uniref:glycosyltransferase n=1 Tax=Rheinheimera sp. TaxID=1869214 RepID=UPI0027BAFE8A|nr:glycosyltransferase [Rheinheimera sp.]